jgi:hypothetical protein
VRVVIHSPWPFTKRLVDKMADSALLDQVDRFTVLRGPRSGGLHMSTILHALYPPKTSEDISERQLSIYGLMGLAFEDRAELALHALAQEADWPFLVQRAEEVDWYGIKGSPDLLLTPKPAFAHLYQTQELSLKVKWRSCRGLPMQAGRNEFSHRWDYELAQCMAYSVPLGTSRAVLLVYFVCGAWKPPVPIVLGWDLEFEDDERDELMDALSTIAGEILTT